MRPSHHLRRGCWVCADITYIPVQRGFLYLVAIMDWATRHVLSWRLSNTMDAGFCAEALGDALARYGQPEIFNTDQGSQFTSLDFTGVLKNASIRISMDGRGRCMDNVPWVRIPPPPPGISRCYRSIFQVSGWTNLSRNFRGLRVMCPAVAVC